MKVCVSGAVTSCNRPIVPQLNFKIDRITSVRIAELHTLPTEDNSGRVRSHDVNIGIRSSGSSQIEVVPHACDHPGRRQVGNGARHVVSIAVTSLWWRRKVKISIRRDRDGAVELAEIRERERKLKVFQIAIV